MSFRENQEVYFKIAPRPMYGAVLKIIDDADPIIVVQPQTVRCRASSLASAEMPASEKSKWATFGDELPKLWQAVESNPADREAWARLREVLVELGWLAKSPE